MKDSLALISNAFLAQYQASATDSNQYLLDHSAAAHHAAFVKCDSLQELTGPLNGRAFTDIYAFIKALPDPIQVAKTNIDGVYSMPLAPGSYLVEAMASRNVLGDTEFYTWLFWIKISKSTSLDLDNENLLSDEEEEEISSSGRVW